MKPLNSGARARYLLRCMSPVVGRAGAAPPAGYHCAGDIQGFDLHWSSKARWRINHDPVFSDHSLFRSTRETALGRGTSGSSFVLDRANDRREYGTASASGDRL